jgi:predicted lipid-binding transport protein (Tim44 family)
VKIVDGSFQWYVRSIVVQSRESRGPLLTSNVPEEGTDLPTRWQPRLAARSSEFVTTHPGFQWSEFQQLVRSTATELQNAWTVRDWERVRPLESDTLFQTHRYWIDAYLKQHLRNVVDGYAIGPIEMVKISTDAFYDAITVRMFASGRDYTVDDSGKIVGGSHDSVRRWSEYWTFIRARATQSVPSATVSCPNCGASVVVGTSGICEHCGGKLTSGEFGWVLSRIEQDEAYQG